MNSINNIFSWVSASIQIAHVCVWLSLCAREREKTNHETNARVIQNQKCIGKIHKHQCILNQSHWWRHRLLPSVNDCLKRNKDKLTIWRKKRKWVKSNLYLWNQQSSMLTERRIWCNQDIIPVIIKSKC